MSSGAKKENTSLDEVARKLFPNRNPKRNPKRYPKPPNPTPSQPKTQKTQIT